MLTGRAAGLVADHNRETGTPLTAVLVASIRESMNQYDLGRSPDL